MHFVLTNFAFGGHGHVEIDVAVACVQIDVGGEVAGDAKRDAAIAGFESPTGGMGRNRFQLSTSTRPSPVLTSSSSKRPFARMWPSPVVACSLPSTFSRFSEPSPLWRSIAPLSPDISIFPSPVRRLTLAFPRHLEL